jgi:hypothetical protein
VISRYEIAEIARSYVGTPFVHKGRAKGRALDCVGLPICTKREMGGLWADGSSPMEEFDYGRQMARTELLAICRAKFIEKNKDQLAVGDLVVLANDTVPGHVAIVGEHNGGHRDGYLTLIHCVNTHRHKCVEHILAPHWRKSIIAAFEFPQPEEVTDHAKLAITIGGAVVGALIGTLLPGLGTMLGAELGAMAGSIIGGLVLPGPKIEGPHLSDSRNLTSSYGVPIPRGYGLCMVAGQMIDDSGLVEHRHENGGSGQPTVVTYTYSWTGALAFGAGIGQIRRLWCDGKCVYDSTGISDTSAAKGWTIRTYPGDEGQLPDSALETLHGAGNVPAYRGLILAIFDDVALDNFGQHRPSIIKAEIAFGNQVSLRVADILSAQGRINDGILSSIAYDEAIAGLTKSVLSNGWSNHVGMFEGGGGATSHVWISGAAGTYTNPSDAIDGNSGTYAYSLVEHDHEYHGCIWKFSGAGSIPDNLQLQILSAVPGISGISGIARSAGIWYSVDNGSNWKQLYDAIARGKQWDYVALPAGTDPNHVQVMAFMDAHDDMYHQVFEIKMFAGRTLSGAELASESPGILDLAGYDFAEYDLSHLSGTLLGYLIANTSTARDALIPLMQACFFEGVESDFVLKFISRGVPAAGTVQVATSLSAGITALQSQNHILYYMFGTYQIGIIDAIADEIGNTSDDFAEITSNTNEAMCADPSGFLWIGGGINPGIVYRVDPTVLEIVASINLANNATFPLNALVAWDTPTGKYLLAGYGAFSSLSLVDRVNNWEINDDTAHNGTKQIAPANGGTSGLTGKTICREPVIDAAGNAWVAIRLTSTNNLKLTRITPVQATVTDGGGHHHADIPQTVFDLGVHSNWDADQNGMGGLLYNPHMNALLMSFGSVTMAWSLDTEDWLATTGAFKLDRYSNVDGGYFVTVTGAHELTVVKASDLSILQVVDLTASPYSWGGSGLGNAVRFPLDWSLLTVWVMDTNRKLYHITLGGSAAVVGLAGDAGTIDEDDLLPQAEDKPIRVTETRIQEQELPVKVTVRYNDYARNYDPSAQFDERRNTVDSADPQEIQIPVTLKADLAKRIASRMLYTVWATRDHKQFKTLPKHMLLDPLDTGFLDYKGKSFPIRLMQQGLGADLSVEFSAQTNENADAVHYSRSTGSTGTENPIPVLSPFALTDLFILDTPLLRDADANDALSGAYFAGHPDTGGTWTGFVLFSSADNVDFSTTLSTTTNQPTYGTVSSALADHPTGSYWDRDDINTITVVLAHGTLASVTDAEIQTGKNWFVLGSEVIAAKTVVDNGGGSYTLSGLYRGLRGTEWAAPSHSSSERFVLILQSDNAVKRNAGSTSLIGTTRYYKAVTINDTIASASSVSHATSGRDLMPYAPYLIDADQASSGDIEVTWTRRTRYGGKWNGFTQGLSIVPLNEAYEAYEIDVMDGSTVMRTLTSDSPSVWYTTAQQIADFGEGQSSIKVRVYQMSATVGRGFRGEKTVASFGGAIGNPSTAGDIVPLGVTDSGDHQHFTLDHVCTYVMVFWNGQKLHDSKVTLAGSSLTLDNPIDETDTLEVWGA